MSKTGSILDATRISDGEMVILKRVTISVHPFEREIAEYFSSKELKMNPRNHCVPIYAVLEPPGDPDDILLVMPLLRLFYNPPLYTVGELVDFLTQIFEVSIGILILSCRMLCNTADVINTGFSVHA